MSADPPHDPGPLFDRIARRAAAIGVIGLGRVGPPPSRAFTERGLPVTGFDIEPDRMERRSAGPSYMDPVRAQAVRAMLDGGRFSAGADFARLGVRNAVLLCAPRAVTRDHARLADRASTPLTAEVPSGRDAVPIGTDHDDLDHPLPAETAALIADTRKAMAARRAARDDPVKA